MSVASGTATTAELRTLAEAVYKLEVMLAPYLSGAAQGGGIELSVRQLGRQPARPRRRLGARDR